MKQVGNDGRVPEQHGESLDERADRVSPERRMRAVQREQAGQGERRAGRQDALPRRPSGRLPEVGRPQRQHGGQQRRPRQPDAGQRPGRRPANGERPDGVPLHRPVEQAQRDHEQAQERQILGVEERVRVQPGMQHEQRQGEERQPPVVEQPARQQVTGQPRRQEQQVGQEVAHQVDAAAVAESQGALQRLHGQERALEGDAVETVMSIRKSAASQDVTKLSDGGGPAGRLVHRHAVVVEHDDADGQQQAAGGQRAAGVPKAGVTAHGRACGRLPPAAPRRPAGSRAAPSPGRARPPAPAPAPASARSATILPFRTGRRRARTASVP